MFMWKLHNLAAPNGDGLRPEILELLASWQACGGAGNVEDIAAHLVDHFCQAGPHPTGRIVGNLPANVVPFRRESETATPTEMPSRNRK